MKNALIIVAGLVVALGGMSVWAAGPDGTELQKQFEAKAKATPLRPYSVSIDAEDIALGSVLNLVQQQTGVEFRSFDIDRQKQVSVSVEDAPVHVLLRQLNFTATMDGESNTVGVKSGDTVRPAHVQMDRLPNEAAPWTLRPTENIGWYGSAEGVGVQAWSSAWNRDGRVGLVLNLQAFREFVGDLQWQVSDVKNLSGESITFETCDRHSPDKIFVPGGAQVVGSIEIAGTRRRYIPIPVTFSNPASGDLVTVGDYQAALYWPLQEEGNEDSRPRLIVTSNSDGSMAPLSKIVLSDDIVLKRKPHIPERKSLGTAGGGGGGSSGGRWFFQDGDWCGCREALTDTLKAGGAQEPYEVDLPHQASKYAVEEIESLSFTLYLPVESTFELSVKLNSRKDGAGAKKDDEAPAPQK